MRRFVAALSVVMSLWPLAALAHPHIFVDARATVTFNDAGEVVSIHNSWTFDQAYSAWASQGLDTNHDGKLSREELQPLADDNMNGLADYEYYTFAGEGKDPNLPFGRGSNPVIVMGDGGKQTLDFDVTLAKPYAIRKALALSIDDPEYYVAISFKDASDITLVNAPKNCTIKMEDPKEMPPALADALYALPPDVTKLPPELEQAMRGMQGEILISCPGGSLKDKAKAPLLPKVAAAAPANALDAINDATGEETGDLGVDSNGKPVGTADAANATSGAASEGSARDAAAPVPAKQALTVPIFTGNIPFGAAPNEPGLNLPRTGFLGWVSAQQQGFYLALENSLAGLKDNWTGFWVLGLLSFLYGIFHAAGPGHGKVVISSYVLANEAQVRRGVLLSFLAAMMQSAVAIGFVLVAASLLGMTAMAMSDAANWIGILSYAMIALLGLWLIARKLFGWGHNHAHDDGEDADPVVAASSRQVLVRQRMGAPAHALAMGGSQLTSFRATGPDAFGRLPGAAHYGHAHGDDAEHGHAHVVTPDQIRGGWREQLGVVIAVGMRPCSGALIVLAFALSQGLLLAGILAVILMGFGTAITTGALAALAVGFKGLARALAGADNKFTATLVWWAELLAAVGVFAFGVVLVLATI
jgi:nickel/cobalt exporter